MPSIVLTPASRASLAPHVRMSFDSVRQRHVLLSPETVTVLNPTGAAIVSLCDGRTVAEVLEELGRRYTSVPEDEVWTFLQRLAARKAVVIGD